MKDARVGVNLPPMHPFCRSTTIAVTKSSDELDGRIAELTDSTGADVDFNTWRKNLQKLPNGKYQYVKPIDISNRSGIINMKISNYMRNENNDSEYGIFEFNEIENELFKSSVGRDIGTFLEHEGFTIYMNYDMDVPPELMGDVLRKDINVYAVNHDNLREVAETIIHEGAHKKYHWDEDQEGEVNCRIYEYFHAHENISNDTIKEIVDFVKQRYGYLPKGDLYGY